MRADEADQHAKLDDKIGNLLLRTLVRLSLTELIRLLNARVPNARDVWFHIREHFLAAKMASLCASRIALARSVSGFITANVP